MNRKHFLSSASALLSAAVLPFTKGMAAEIAPLAAPTAIIPPYLKAGDTIGITSPAGFITPGEISPSVKLMESWGYRIKTGATIGKRYLGFGGTDEERAGDFQEMIDDGDIRAVMCARGGYGVIRIIDTLNWKKFKQKPKWIIGFSDITVLHEHINRNFGIATVHSKMCNSFPDDWSRAEPVQVETILSIRQLLSGEKMKYAVRPDPFNRQGHATGALVGGNLKTIESLTGSASDIRTDGKILFVEDTGEYLYSIDRMFWNLKRTGKLARLQGLIIGGFKVKPDDPGEEFGKTLYEIVLEKVKEYDYPVCFNFPVGHQKDNFALKYGATHVLEVKNNECILKDL